MDITLAVAIFFVGVSCIVAMFYDRLAMMWRRLDGYIPAECYSCHRTFQTRKTRKVYTTWGAMVRLCDACYNDYYHA